MGWPPITQTPADVWYSYIFLILIIPAIVFIILLGVSKPGTVLLVCIISFILSAVLLFKPFVKMEKEREKNWK